MSQLSRHKAPRLLTNAVTDLVSRLNVCSLEIPALGIDPSATTSAVEARLVSSSASTLALSFTRVPARLHADRPLEKKIAAVGISADSGIAETVANWLSAHARLTIAVDKPVQPQREVSVLVKARPCDGGWNVHALIRRLGLTQHV